MEPSQLLRHVVDQLERLRLPYLVTGSIAAEGRVDRRDGSG